MIPFMNQQTAWVVPRENSSNNGRTERELTCNIQWFGRLSSRGMGMLEVYVPPLKLEKGDQETVERTSHYFLEDAL